MRREGISTCGKTGLCSAHPGLAHREWLETFVEAVCENDSLEDLVLLCNVLVLSG